MNAVAAQPKAAATQPLLFALVGNPNCGKTTVFNALTGLRQKVANYPGVTVEKKIGECFSQHGALMRIIDLPGAYSLNARSPDEAVLRDVLLGRRADTPRPDRVICIADASNLERNLYLVTQVLELGLPTILVLNMIDVAEAKQWRIDVARLSELLGIPVIPMQATTGKGLVELKVAMSKAEVPTPHWRSASLPDLIQRELQQSRDALRENGAVHANATLLEPLYLLSDHDPSHSGIANAHLNQIAGRRKHLEKTFPGWEDQLVSDRYAAIEKLCAEVLRRPHSPQDTRTDKLDRVLLHPVWGFASLVFVLSALFYTIFSVAEAPMGFIETSFNSLGEWVQGKMAPGDLRDLIVQGVIAGVSGVVIFLPQILILFFFIGLMEDTGYMARIAFIMDWLMSKVGLNGKSFLPMLSSYACAIPGIMATRTIDNPKDRLITILVAPLASCSARLPVYGLLIPAMLPRETAGPLTKAGLMLGMYALGTFGAFFFAWLFNKGVMRGVSSPMILEMPDYKMPALKSVLLHMWERARLFLTRAGTVILGLSILIWAASTYPKSEGTASQQLANSVAGQAGHLIEPIIKPLGYDWKIGIGLISSFAAREVFVNTMSVVYSVESEDEDLQPLRQRLQGEKWDDGRPVYTPLVCLSLMVFYVFAMQCMSTIAIVRRETGGWKWPMFQLGYMTATAYVMSLLVYQIGRAMGY
jgi:ferrous iron transport protein B